METVAEIAVGPGQEDTLAFFVKAMIGAVAADDLATPSERIVVEDHLVGHPLVPGLVAEEVALLVQRAADALSRIPSEQRLAAIARGLPGRLRRYIAYGLTAEISCRTSAPPDADARLENLRVALRMSPHEGALLTEAAIAGRLVADLDDRLLRLRGMVPTCARVFALRAQSHETLTDDHRFAVRDMFLAIPDLVRPRDELDVELYQAFRRPRDPMTSVHAELREIGQALPDPVDRYWIVVYVLAADPPDRAGSWRLNPFVGMLQACFHIGDADMDLAAADASAFPPSFPRPA